MKIEKKYIVIGVCMIIGAILTVALAFVGPNIITSGTINNTKVVTGNLKLNITDTSITLNNMAPIRSSVYETEAFKKEFTISSSNSTLNGCLKLYLNFNSISEQLKSEYLVYKVVSSTGNVSEGSFKDIADNKLLIYDSDFIETGKSITYTLYIWLRYVEDPTINLASLLGTSIDGYVSVNGSDTKESTSCTFDSSKKISYVVTFMNTDNKTVLETRKVSSGSTLGSLPSTRQYFTKTGGNGTEYTSTSTITDDALVYPKLTKFELDSWTTIATNVRNGNTGDYNVGDTKEVNLGTTYGTHTLRIANTTTPSECSTSGFSQTACGFVLEFADIITTYEMNDTDTNVGGWPASSMYDFVNYDIYNSLPSDLKSTIIDTTVVSSHGSTNGENFTSIDKLYLLSLKEVYSDWSTNSYSSYDSAKDLTRTLDYYINKNVTSSDDSETIKKYKTTDSWWWLREAHSNYDHSFFIVPTDDYSYLSTYANTSGGVSPAFRIG